MVTRAAKRYGSVRFHAAHNMTPKKKAYQTIVNRIYRLRASSASYLTEESVHLYLKAIECPCLIARGETGMVTDTPLYLARKEACGEWLRDIVLPGSHHLHVRPVDDIPFMRRARRLLAPQIACTVLLCLCFRLFCGSCEKKVCVQDSDRWSVPHGRKSAHTRANPSASSLRCFGLESKVIIPELIPHVSPCGAEMLSRWSCAPAVKDDKADLIILCFVHEAQLSNTRAPIAHSWSNAAASENAFHHNWRPSDSSKTILYTVVYASTSDGICYS